MEVQDASTCAHRTAQALRHRQRCTCWGLIASCVHSSSCELCDNDLRTACPYSKLWLHVGGALRQAPLFWSALHTARVVSSHSDGAGCCSAMHLCSAWAFTTGGGVDVAEWERRIGGTGLCGSSQTCFTNHHALCVQHTSKYTATTREAYHPHRTSHSMTSVFGHLCSHVGRLHSSHRTLLRAADSLTQNLFARLTLYASGPMNLQTTGSSLCIGPSDGHGWMCHAILCHSHTMFDWRWCGSLTGDVWVSVRPGFVGSGLSCLLVWCSGGRWLMQVDVAVRHMCV